MQYAELLYPEQTPAELEVLLELLEPIRGKLKILATQSDSDNILTDEEVNKLIENDEKQSIYEQYHRVRKCVRQVTLYEDVVFIPIPGINSIDFILEQLLIAENPIASAKEFVADPVKFARDLGFTTVLDCPNSLKSMNGTYEYIDVRKIFSAGYVHFICAIVFEPWSFEPTKSNPHLYNKISKAIQNYPTDTLVPITELI